VIYLRFCVDFDQFLSGADLRGLTHRERLLPRLEKKSRLNMPFRTRLGGRSSRVDWWW
jgi:hypothetical protein